MQNKPLISILIVAYNPWEYLRKTLESCITQTYENTEILILDNASNEDITQYFPKSEKIKLTKSTTNLGPYNGLNWLLEQAQWTYIAIQDHDDIWHREKLEKQVDFLENNPQYIGCGTKTVMYYEGDRKYFEYILGKENYYTIHPSLLFRYDGKFRYDTTETGYMCDAWSLKRNLCHEEKVIYNLEESLTLHLIKKWSTNYSYKWYTLSSKNIKRAYDLHTFSYATLTLWWELMRKICYPIFQKLWCGKWIDPIERVPFRMFWNQIKTTQWNEWWNELLGK
jgi:glycosyltransferase involved in cell wall biosynthesis